MYKEVMHGQPPTKEILEYVEMKFEIPITKCGSKNSYYTVIENILRLDLLPKKKLGLLCLRKIVKNIFKFI